MKLTPEIIQEYKEKCEGTSWYYNLCLTFGPLAVAEALDPIEFTDVTSIDYFWNKAKDKMSVDQFQVYWIQYSLGNITKEEFEEVIDEKND